MGPGEATAALEMTSPEHEASWSLVARDLSLPNAPQPEAIPLENTRTVSTQRAGPPIPPVALSTPGR